MAQTADIKITANTAQAQREMSAFTAKVQGASDAVKGSFASIATGASNLRGHMGEAFGQVGGTIGMVQARFAALAGLLAGGAVLKESVAATVNFTKEATSLGRALGICTGEAAAWNVALGDVYASAEDMTGASAKLAKQLTTNEAGLNALGLKTRDAGGNFRGMSELMLDAIKIANSYAEGTDRTIVMQRLFGKGASEMTALLKLNTEAVEAAKEKQRELGLVVGVENIEATKRYRAVMNDVGDVLLAVKKAIGDAVMPVLTKLGEWFAGIGPAAVVVIKGAIGGLVSVFWGLKNAVSIVWQVLDSFVFTIAEPLKSLAEALWKVVQGDFKGAADVMMTFTDRIGQRWSAAWQAMAESSEETRDRIVALFATPTEAAPVKDGGKRASGGEGDDTRMQRWEAELDRQKVAHEQLNAEQGTFYRFGLEREAAYWGAILATMQDGDKLQFAVKKRFVALKLELRKQEFEAEQAALLTRIDGARGEFEQQAALAAQHVELVRQRFGAESKEYQQALQKQQALLRTHEAAALAIANARRDAERGLRLEEAADLERAAERELSLGLITQQQLLEVRRLAIGAREQIEREAKAAEIAAMRDGPNDPVALEKLLAEQDAIRRRFSGPKDDNAAQQLQVQADPLQSIFGVTQQQIQTGLESMVMQGKLTLGGLRDAARQVGAVMLRELVTKPMADWIVMKTRKLVLERVFGMQEVAVEAGTAGKKTAIQAATSGKSIAMKAYEAAAGAYAAIAGIPYVGPVLAPIAAGVALAGVLAFAKSIFSAEGGMDIPGGMNPIIQAHAKEMMLPAEHANTIRSLARVHLASGPQIDAPRHADTVQRLGEVLQLAQQQRQSGPVEVVLRAENLGGDLFMARRSELIRALQSARRDFAL